MDPARSLVAEDPKRAVHVIKSWPAQRGLDHAGTHHNHNTCPWAPGVERAAVVLIALGEDHAAGNSPPPDPRELHKIGVGDDQPDPDQSGIRSARLFTPSIRKLTNRVPWCWILKIIFVEADPRLLGRKPRGVLDHIFDNETGSGVDSPGRDGCQRHRLRPAG
ncbi:MAG: hypothetical protein IPL99_04305 [Candidatus Competibacteraceae bacterium]|nr:hypothetical protein [Candidatus Competibacteraceae bacterium]